ncbi:hypothetical protein PANDA_003032 [Ailuropoda melanoleuca]|uniref:Uncharacterized protein n=1 Tax=Ailuropoda melanoleuca TaxID=9646 RepID=D2H0R4_AILME|nr:hypothetical protein PANDA_003032 [Ailuropoda melanoleuca]
MLPPRSPKRAPPNKHPRRAPPDTLRRRAGAVISALLGPRGTRKYVGEKFPLPHGGEDVGGERAEDGEQRWEDVSGRRSKTAEEVGAVKENDDQQCSNTKISRQRAPKGVRSEKSRVPSRYLKSEGIRQRQLDKATWLLWGSATSVCDVIRRRGVGTDSQSPAKLSSCLVAGRSGGKESRERGKSTYRASRLGHKPTWMDSFPSLHVPGSPIICPGPFPRLK